MNTSNLLCDKLRTSSLFQIYRPAFESVTGYHLDLRREAVGEISIPVPVGKTKPCLLVAEAIHPGADRSPVGILESFAMQLGEEANRAILDCEGANPQAVKDALRYLREYSGGKIRLEVISAELGICSFQLCRLFRKHTGVTMTEYVNRHRVEKARRALEDPSRQISEIASAAGFSSLTGFNRNFLKYAGESPTEYRDRLSQLEHHDLIAAYGRSTLGGGSDFLST